MRRWWLSVACMLAPLAVMAAGPTTDFHRCATDEDCVLVQGICGKAAVNKLYALEAQRFYEGQGQEKKACGSVFWRPEAKTTRCRLESCEAMPGNQ